jgi:hypothetical protein
MIAPPFPILTFDTTKLAPTWGYVFKAMLIKVSAGRA